MNFINNKYITTFISLCLIICILCLNKNININVDVYNNIIFKLLYLLLIFIVNDKDYQLSIYLTIMYIMLDHITTNNQKQKMISEFEHSNQLEHYTQDYLIENNIK